LVSAVPTPTPPLPATQPKPPVPGVVAPQKAVRTPAVPAPTLPLPAIQPKSPVPGAAVPQPAVPAPPAPALATPVVAPQSMKFEAESPAAKKAVLKVTAPKTVKTNDEFQVAIDVSDATNVYNGMLAVQYDPGVLNFVDSVEGKFLNKDGKPTSYKHVFNALKGRVNLNMYRIGNVNGVSGSGTLAYLTFKAKAKGTAKLGLSDVYLLPQGSNKYLNVDLHSSTTEVQ
jgi:general secretion pathway protein D